MTGQEASPTAREEMELADRTGRQGEPHRAALLYQGIGDRLREHLGPYHELVLDAYEGVWPAGSAQKAGTEPECEAAPYAEGARLRTTRARPLTTASR